MTDWLLDGVFAWMAARVLDVLGWQLQFMTASFFTTPDVTVLPQVAGLAQRSARVVDAGFVLAILAAGVLAMRPTSAEVAYQVKDLVPRLVVAFGLSVFGVAICRGLIGVFNAVTTTLVGEAASGPETISYVQQALRLAFGPTAVLAPGLRAMMGLIALLIVVLFLQLLAGYVVRVATLLVLAGVAPVALACYALPQTQPVAVVWWRTLLGVLVTPALQGVAFSAGIDLLLSPDHNVSTLLFGGGVLVQGGLETFNLFLAACLLWVTVRIPRLVSRYVLTAPRTSAAGVVVRAVAVQTFLRRVPGLSRVAR